MPPPDSEACRQWETSITLEQSFCKNESFWQTRAFDKRVKNTWGHCRRNSNWFTSRKMVTIYSLDTGAFTVNHREFTLDTGASRNHYPGEFTLDTGASRSYYLSGRHYIPNRNRLVNIVQEIRLERQFRNLIRQLDARLVAPRTSQHLHEQRLLQRLRQQGISLYSLDVIIGG